MKKAIRTLSAVLSAALITVTFCSCGAGTEEQESHEYDYLDSEIVGIWYLQGGPTISEVPLFGDCFMFFEFTSDNQLINHYINLNEQMGNVLQDNVVNAGTYRVDENTLVYEKENAGAVIDIQDDVMSMSNDKGSTYYVKATMELLTTYGVAYQDEENAAEQAKYRAKLAAEEEAALESAYASDTSVSVSEITDEELQEESAAEASENTDTEETTASASDTAAEVEETAAEEASVSE